MADQSSFFVHLQSLADFAQELQTQLAGMATPINHLDTMSSSPMQLGAFGEANELAAANQAAVAEMTELLGQVRQAITFAESITNTVATGYQQADQNVAGGMKVDANAAALNGATSAASGLSGSSGSSHQDSSWATSVGNGNSGGTNSGGGGWT
jgi:acyl-homoserine lactone acylase PvdQ